MPRLCKAKRDPIIERRQMVLDCLMRSGQMSCADICEALGMRMHNVRAAMRALCEGGAARKCGGIKNPTYSGHNDTYLYAATGEAYSAAIAASTHKEQAKQDHYAEPAGRIVEKELAPGHRLIRFGRDYKTGRGQLADNRYTAGSVLNSIY